MSENPVKYSWGELLDRFTILIRKATFDPPNYKSKLEAFTNALSELQLDSALLLLICNLQMVNTEIWTLESDIRKGCEGELGLTEVGRRALRIRDLNKTRIETVNAINHLLGDDTTERKFDHASQ